MRVCDFIIFEIPILTVEMIIVVDHTLSYCQNRELKYNKITNSHYLQLQECHYYVFSSYYIATSHMIIVIDVLCQM